MISVNPPFKQIFEPAPGTVKIKHDFWGRVRLVNREKSVFHQWEQLKETGRINNFMITGGMKKGTRKGFFYNDSDVHKWAEAAALVLAERRDKKLEALLKEYITIMDKARDKDGYLFTYNQLHFPGKRWVNLQIEHELYTMGHVIEAGVSHFTATGKRDLLGIAVKCADLIVEDFSDMRAEDTPGHEEIEIALMRLYRITGISEYRDTAERFLEKRGRIGLFPLHLVRQFIDHGRRTKHVESQKQKSAGEADTAGFDFTENILEEDNPFLLGLRSKALFLTGRYFQQHRPIRKLKVPTGHSVRWGYLATATAMLYQERGDAEILTALEKAWEHMVERRMYVSGGIGSLPLVEGFGLDYELNNSHAYCETCAALASIFWNREMLAITGNARYSDLIEWQLYNAALPGVSLDGISYLYRNSLESSGSLVRKPWFDTACCPGNISRTMASLESYIYSSSEGSLWIHQYIGCSFAFSPDGKGGDVEVNMQSGFPWDGKVTIVLKSKRKCEMTIHLRIPSWAAAAECTVNGRALNLEGPAKRSIPTASDLNPGDAWYAVIPLVINNGSSAVEMNFPMHVKLHHAHRKVQANRGKAALSRGPLLYCLESRDNDEVAIPGAVLDREKSIAVEKSDTLIAGMNTLRGTDESGKDLVFIPYFCWANRGPSSMQVWLKEKP